jgi:hypothetical protein
MGGNEDYGEGGGYSTGSVLEIDTRTRERGRESRTHLKTTTGAEAAISLALASAIATDSGLEEDEEAMPITARGSLYIYTAGGRGATGGGVRVGAACATDDRVARPQT